MFRAYKYRLYPTDEQKVAIHHHLGCARWIYNYALDKKTKAYTIDKVNLSRFDIQANLPKLKQQPETAWLKEVNSQTLQASLENMDKAFRSFFKQTGGFPKFKSKKDNRQSFQVPASAKLDWEKQTLSIPKIKGIPAILHRRFEPGGRAHKIKTVTITKTPTSKYFASVAVDVAQEPKPVQPVKPATTVGLDTGIKTFVVSSDGQAFENAKHLKNSLARLKVLQKRASRKAKGSVNRKKANLKVARLHEKINNQRLNHIHQVTSKLTTNSEIQTICIEDLNVKGMMANHNLAQSLSDVSLGKFYEVLRYKCEWQGIHLVQIGRWEASSKTCSRCGSHKAELTLADREYHCNHCGSIMDRDVNAAINIKNFGLVKHSSTDSAVELGEMPEISGSENQEALAL
jgi:putative transposase